MTEICLKKVLVLQPKQLETTGTFGVPSLLFEKPTPRIFMVSIATLFTHQQGQQADTRNELGPFVRQDCSTPPPPGFMTSRTSLPSSPGRLQRRMYYGEEMRTGEGAVSAPPPPGFNGGQDERARMANQLWKAPVDPTSFTARTSSFTNLAAMIGTGLAESMEDSTTSDYTRAHLGGDLSYARQTRHAASRLIGGSATSPTATLLNLALPSTANNRRSDTSFLIDPPRSTSSASMYSGENDPLTDFRASVQHQKQPPLGIFNLSGRPSEVGMTVMEPDLGRSSAPPQLYTGEVLSGPGTPISSRQSTPGLSRQGTPEHFSDMHRAMQNLGIDGRSIQSDHSASEIELEPFIWNPYHAEPSRALVILHATNLTVQEIRATCEAFGALEVFRADFAERGIIFVGYYDIRSAQYAAQELKQCFRRLSPDCDAEIKYCVPMNSSSSHDESIIWISDLPYNVTDQSLMGTLSAYGAVRSLNAQPGNQYRGKSYVVEFHNLQDAKLALLELESSQPWGPDVLMEVGSRRAVDRKRGRELLSVIAKWRTGNAPQRHHSAEPGMYPKTQSFASKFATERSEDSPSLATQESYSAYRNESDGNASKVSQQQTTQLVRGPDGRYTYMVVNPSAFPPQQRHTQSHQHMDPHGGMRVVRPQVSHQQHVVHGPHGTYLASVPTTQAQAYWQHQSQHQQSQFQSSGCQPSNMNSSSYGMEGSLYSQQGGTGAPMPYYAHVVTSPTTGDSSVSSGSQSNAISTLQQQQHQQRRQVPVDDKDNRHLTLELEAVELGRDTRTSLMVRNIPNKYTQQMLLSEFADNGHGPGKIDFFYLPIDFKNKCNRGYAFINFVDYKDIIPFHRQYFGQNWRVFNSDKICDITYARIQGKSGMLKRFENSALMEKDEEYKPLVFVSHGADKGKRLPFPSEQ